MNSTTVLLVGHGSREKSGNDEIEQFAAQWRARQPQWRIDICFIEFSVLTLDVGMANAAKNSQRVIVVPLILNAAGHVKMEIPDHIAHARDDFPGVRFDYAPHLTACDPILAILKRRLRDAMLKLDMPDPTSTGVVVLGRGASDRQANGEMAKMARWLMEETDHELVDLAFTGITWPRLEKAVQRQVLLGMTNIVVLRYYLFSGTLVERISRQVEHLRAQYPTVRFALSQHFGFETEIFELLETRVRDLVNDVPSAAMPCDGCKFREIAQEAGHGHSHAHTVPTLAGIPVTLEAHAAHEHGHEHAHEHGHAHAHPHAAPEHGHAHPHAAHAHPHAEHEHPHGHAHDH